MELVKRSANAAPAAGWQPPEPADARWLLIVPSDRGDEYLYRFVHREAAAAAANTLIRYGTRARVAEIALIVVPEATLALVEEDSQASAP